MMSTSTLSIGPSALIIVSTSTRMPGITDTVRRGRSTRMMRREETEPRPGSRAMSESTVTTKSSWFHPVRR